VRRSRPTQVCRASKEGCIKITAFSVVKLFNLVDVSDVSDENVASFSE
jgi:hypothetical protein